MKELQFRTLENLKVPDELMDRLLAIPETEGEKPPVPLWRKPRFIAMAASVMLVTALSIALFLSMGSKPPVATKSDSKPDATQIVWSTDEYGATVATEVVVPDAQNDDQPTEHKSGITRFFENLFGITEPTTPTASDGQGGSTPSDDRNGRTPQSPTVSPQQPTAAPRPVIPDPTTAPQPVETDPPRETEAPWDNPSEPSWDDPTQAPTPPTESPSEVTSTIVVWLPVSVIPEDGKVFCKVISLRTGKTYGDFGEYDDNRQMSCTYKDSKYWYYSYHCRQYFDVPKVFQSDEVVYYVYDSEGTVLYSNTTYLGSWV